MTQILYLEGQPKYNILKYEPVEGFLGKSFSSPSLKPFLEPLRQPFPQSFGLEKFQDGSNGRFPY
jgi:hypothetical protein